MHGDGKSAALEAAEGAAFSDSQSKMEEKGACSAEAFGERAVGMKRLHPKEHDFDGLGDDEAHGKKKRLNQADDELLQHTEAEEKPTAKPSQEHASATGSEVLPENSQQREPSEQNESQSWEHDHTLLGGTDKYLLQGSESSALGEGGDFRNSFIAVKSASSDVADTVGRVEAAHIPAGLRGGGVELETETEPSDETTGSGMMENEASSRHREEELESAQETRDFHHQDVVKAEGNEEDYVSEAVNAGDGVKTSEVRVRAQEEESEAQGEGINGSVHGDLVHTALQEAEAGGGVHADPIAEGGVHADPIAEGGVHADPNAEGGVRADPSAEDGVRADPSAEGGVHADPSAEGGVRADPSAEQTDAHLGQACHSLHCYDNKDAFVCEVSKSKKHVLEPENEDAARQLGLQIDKQHQSAPRDVSNQSVQNNVEFEEVRASDVPVLMAQPNGEGAVFFYPQAPGHKEMNIGDMEDVASPYVSERQSGQHHVWVEERGDCQELDDGVSCGALTSERAACAASEQDAKHSPERDECFPAESTQKREGEKRADAEPARTAESLKTVFGYLTKSEASGKNTFLHSRSTAISLLEASPTVSQVFAGAEAVEFRPQKCDAPAERSASNPDCLFREWDSGEAHTGAMIGLEEDFEEGRATSRKSSRAHAEGRNQFSLGPTSKEILKMIMDLDDMMAKTKKRIEEASRAETDAHGSAHSVAQKLGIPCSDEESSGHVDCGKHLPASSRAIYSHNEGVARKIREETCNLLWIHSKWEYDAQPIYSSVQESPFYQDNITRHQVLKPYIERAVRKTNYERRSKSLDLAFDYKDLEAERQDLIGHQKRSKIRKSERDGDPGSAPKRKTRSSNADLGRTSVEFEAIFDLERQQHTTEGAAEIPDMIVTESERKQHFVNNSGLVVDPVSDEKLRKLCNLWSEEEKQVFLEKLADFAVRSEKEGLRKNFYKISHYLPNKTTNDCVEYYYLAKKSKAFKEKFKKLELKHRRTHHLRRKMNTVLMAKVSGGVQSVTVDLDALTTTRKNNDKAEEVLILSSLGYECLDSYDDINLLHENAADSNPVPPKQQKDKEKYRYKAALSVSGPGIATPGANGVAGPGHS